MGARDLRVLIVEDEGIPAHVLKMQLEKKGYTVLGPVATAEAAIERALKDRPECIVMDIHLSGKKDGIYAAEHIRAEYAPNIIFLTGYEDKNSKERAMLLAPLSYLIKPVDVQQIVHVLEP